MADVYRILGQLPDGADQMTTADGRAKTIEASRARLARMVGCDADDADAAWRMLAQWLAERQIRTIVDGAMLVLSSARVPADAPLLGAGIGEARAGGRSPPRAAASFRSAPFSMSRPLPASRHPIARPRPRSRRSPR